METGFRKMLVETVPVKKTSNEEKWDYEYVLRVRPVHMTRVTELSLVRIVYDDRFTASVRVDWMTLDTARPDVVSSIFESLLGILEREERRFVEEVS